MTHINDEPDHADEATTSIPGDAHGRASSARSPAEMRRRDLRQRPVSASAPGPVSPSDHMRTARPAGRCAAGVEPGKSSRRGEDASSRPDARSSDAGVLSTQDRPTDGPRHTQKDPGPRSTGPTLAVDQRVLQTIVDLKYLSAEQLRTLAFPAVDISLVRRWLRRLEAEKWVRLWSPFTARGGKTKYALPTKRALRWALEERRRGADGTELERLARLLIPTTTRAPVSFAPGSLPPYFAHQREANDMVIAFQRSSVEMLWATTWDRPLPRAIDAFVPPQPDGIIVVRHRTGALHLLFLEHDRGTEKPEMFATTKRRYLFLALSPAFVKSMFGVAAFSVLVTVEAANTERRIVELQMAAMRAGFPATTLRFYDAAYVRAAAARDAAQERRSGVAGAMSGARDEATPE